MQPQNYHFQCDCACADDGFALTATHNAIFSNQMLLHQPRLHTQALPGNHSLLFHPQRHEALAVLNPAAMSVWQQYTVPRSLASVSSQNASLETGVDLPGVTRGLFELGLLEADGYEICPQRGQARTLSVWLHVTNQCNLRCDYCYIHKSDADMSEETGRAAIDAVIRSALAHDFEKVKLKFAGGEALMNIQRVLSLHSYALQASRTTGLELDTVVLSNGVAIGERTIAAFKEAGIRISISLDGIGDAHDAQRRFVNGRGSFAWVDRTIQRLIDSDLKPFISITLSGRNAFGLADVVQYVLDRELPFNINFFRDNECASPHTDLQLQEEGIINAMYAAFDVIEANLPRRGLLGSLVDRAQFDTPHEKTCAVGDSYLVIDHQGNVAKCQMEIEQPVTTVFDIDPLQAIRQDLLGIQNLPVTEKEGCRDCEWRYWCAGGCPALTYRATGRYDVKSPNCNIYKAIYPELLRLEGLRLLKLAAESQEYASRSICA
jgi:uncharacterized protein